MTTKYPWMSVPILASTAMLCACLSVLTMGKMAAGAPPDAPADQTENQAAARLVLEQYSAGREKLQSGHYSETFSSAIADISTETYFDGSNRSINGRIKSLPDGKICDFQMRIKDDHVYYWDSIGKTLTSLNKSDSVPFNSNRYHYLPVHWLGLVQLRLGMRGNFTDHQLFNRYSESIMKHIAIVEEVKDNVLLITRSPVQGQAKIHQEILFKRGEDTVPIANKLYLKSDVNEYLKVSHFYQIDWQKIDGVMVPIRFYQDKDESERIAFDMRLDWRSVNKPVDQRLFDKEGITIPKDDTMGGSRVRSPRLIESAIIQTPPSITSEQQPVASNQQQPSDFYRGVLTTLAIQALLIAILYGFRRLRSLGRNSV